MGELGEILHDQVRADAIARQICKRGLEDVHSSEHGELVEHQQDRIPVSVAALAFSEVHCLGEPAHDLLEQEPQERASPVDVRGWDREVAAEILGALDRPRDPIPRPLPWRRCVEPDSKAGHVGTQALPLASRGTVDAPRRA
jgi:hypothetical protein